MTIGLLVVDHGSRRAASNAQLVAVAEALRQRWLQGPVSHAHMEIAEPDVARGVATLVAAGATEIRLLLYFLSDGRHARQDLPRLAAEAAAQHPGLHIEVSPPLGPHPLLVELLLARGGLLDEAAPCVGRDQRGPSPQKKTGRARPGAD